MRFAKKTISKPRLKIIVHNFYNNYYVVSDRFDTSAHNHLIVNARIMIHATIINFNTLDK